MKHGRWMIAVWLAGCALTGGCERQAPATQAQQPASSAPAATAQGETPPSTAPAASVININGRSAIFPAARLRLEPRGERLVATLFSDDPREALKTSYTGNSFYLSMELEISDAAELGQTEWQFKAPSAASDDDSPYGIFLAGHKTQLEPFDVRARFRREPGGAVTVLLGGQFKVLEAGDSRGPAQMVVVGAELAARLDRVPSSAP